MMLPDMMLRWGPCRRDLAAILHTRRDLEPFTSKISGQSRRCSTKAASADKHYAVVGAGLAGLATAYNLLKLAGTGHAVHVTVIDAVGIGAGGSGAAAGLLHPFTPKGKLLWRAEEAMSAAVHLLQAAEAAAAQSTDLPDCIAWRTGMLRPAANTKQSQDYWKIHSQQQQTQAHLQEHQHQQDNVQHQAPDAAAALHALLHASVADASTACQLVPGVVLPVADSKNAAADQQQPEQQQQQQQPQKRKQSKQQHQKLSGWTPTQAAALHIPGGITLHPLHYMQALWAACQLAAAARDDGSSAQLQIQQLSSLADLHSSSSSSSVARSGSSSSEGRSYDAIVVAAGAAVGSLAEIGEQLPISLCQGYTLDLIPPNHGSAALAAAACGSNHDGAPSSSSSSSAPQVNAANAAASLGYGATSPSLLGSPYLASQAGQVLVVGATKQHNWTTQQAVGELGRTINPDTIQHQQQAGVKSGGGAAAAAQSLASNAAAAAAGMSTASIAAVDAEVAAAADELMSGAAAVWPDVSGWTVCGIRTGVRALPPRTQQGAVPIAGRWTAGSCQDEDSNGTDRLPPVWLLVGLGARGLVYHAWLGQLTAAAVLADSEQQLPPELLAWRDGTAEQRQ